MLAVVLTPPGRSALAVVHVSGEGAEALVRRIFARTFGAAPVYGRLCHLGEVIDEVLVRRADGFTGEETVEITCHGGWAPIERLLGVLGELGARRAGPRELLERGFDTGHLDRIQVEALELLPGAKTERAAQMLSDQAEGALSRRVARMDTTQEARRILETAPLGLALAHPRRVVLAGAPNVGKSTLFNALAERDRVLVSPVAGTTRDPVRETIAIEGMPLELVDTAGLEAPRDPLEERSIGMTREALAEADLVLHVVEPGSGAPGASAALPSAPEGRPKRIEVLNKIDQGGGAVPAGAWPVSARTGQGLPELRQAILEALELPRTQPGEPGIVFTPRQASLLGRAAQGACGVLEARREALRGPP